MPAKKTLKIESFRPGTHTSSDGTRLTFTAADVRAIATGYDFAAAPAPIVVGHPKTDDPAFGWCAAFTYDEARERLIADTGELSPAFAESIEAGHYRKVSMALFAPDHPSNPKPGQWYPRHLGFLGAAPPAVVGLAPVAFADDGTKVIEVEFAAAGWAIKDLFSRLRDYWIDKFGLEEADKALPSYLVDSTEYNEPQADPAYSATETTERIMPEATNTNTATVEQLAAAQARIAQLENDLNARNIAAARANAATFCATLVEKRLLAPADRPAVEAALVAIESAAAVEFAAADGSTSSETPAAVIRRVLENRNPIVSEHEISGAADDPAPVARFSAPAGMRIEPADAAMFARAKAYQAEHPGADFSAALRAVVAAA